MSFPLEKVENDQPVVDMAQQVELVRQAEVGGFAAAWARDVPLFDPDFVDVGQVYDPWTFLSWIGAQTSTIALGTAGVVLPLHHPIDVAKQSASLDQLTGGRFLLGVVSGDRPIEYPAYGKDAGARGQDFREAVAFIKKAQSVKMRPVTTGVATLRGADVVPKPTADHVPLLVTGSSQQSMEWIAQNGDGWITYPRGPQQQRKLAEQWHAMVAGTAAGTGNGSDRRPFKPFAQSLGVDLVADPDAEMSSLHMGYRLGRNALIKLLEFHQSIGVNHIILGLRPSSASGNRPLKEIIDELNEHVLPHFSA